MKDSQNKFHEHTGSLSNASKEAETSLHDEDEPSLVTKSNPTASLFAEKMASRRNSRSIRGR
ncbi:hypothetical protein [Pseudoalteromonas luteoviolacea]|uniref:hypothetical protein n=1 Tax=Pseudoalteromonas luteoviolacea TaxID=43657 RepID=UPI0012DAAF8D|nr:hypothetical protein [Pseudoalteromonas luteoviolacea]